jgi:hypothetical protein
MIVRGHFEISVKHEDLLSKTTKEPSECVTVAFYVTTISSPHIDSSRIGRLEPRISLIKIWSITPRAILNVTLPLYHWVTQWAREAVSIIWRREKFLPPCLELNPVLPARRQSLYRLRYHGSQQAVCYLLTDVAWRRLLNYIKTVRPLEVPCWVSPNFFTWAKWRARWVR